MDELAVLLRQLVLHVRGLFEKASELASLGFKRIKLRAVDGFFGLIFGLATLAAGVTILVSSALLVVSGLRHALARWAGADWVGEIGGGMIALSLPFVVLLLVRRKVRRDLLEKALHGAATSAAMAGTPVTVSEPVAGNAPAGDATTGAARSPS